MLHKFLLFYINYLGKQEEIPPPIEKTINKTISTANQTLKQRLNSIVLKTLQENTGRDRQMMMHQTQDAWKKKLMYNTRVIRTTRECQTVIEDIMNRKDAKTMMNAVTSDSEGKITCKTFYAKI